MGFSEDESENILHAHQYIALVSFVASVLVILTVVCVPALRNGDRFQTIAMMCLWNALYESTYAFGKNRHDHQHSCNLLAVLDQAGAIGVILWNFNLSTELFVTVVLHGKMKSNIMTSLLANKFIVKHVFAIVGITIFSLVPLAADQYGQVGSFCWIKENSDNDDAFRFAFFYGPLWIVVVWEVFVYFQIVRVFRSLQELGILTSGYAEKANKVLNALGLYPLMLMLAWFFPTINRIQNSADRNDPVYWLYMAQAVSMHLQGLMFACVFFFHDPQVFCEIRRQTQHVGEQGCCAQPVPQPVPIPPSVTVAETDAEKGTAK